MNPLLKKALAALAIKEGIERIQEMRQPKRRSRLGPLALIAGVGVGTYVLAKNGKLQPLLDKAKSFAGGDKAAPASRTRFRHLHQPERQRTTQRPDRLIG